MSKVSMLLDWSRDSVVCFMYDVVLSTDCVICKYINLIFLSLPPRTQTLRHPTSCRLMAFAARFLKKSLKA